MPALVIGVVKTRGLQLQLPSHHIGDAHFTDLLDSYEDHPESRYHLNQFVRCRVMFELTSVRRKWAVSLRPSRFVNTAHNTGRNLAITCFVMFRIHSTVACHVGSPVAHNNVM